MVQRDYVFKRDTGDVLVLGEKLRYDRFTQCARRAG